jgi:hypothetical protein
MWAELARRTRRGLLRFRHPLGFGAVLERNLFELFLPIALAGPALCFVMTMIVVLEFASASPGRLAGVAAFAGFLLFATLWLSGIMIGYVFRSRWAIPPDLADKLRPEPDFFSRLQVGLRTGRNTRIILFLTGGNLKRALWVAALGVWAIVLLVLQGLVSGELVPDWVAGG